MTKWKLVPVEPTPTQIRSGQLGVTTDCTKAIYRAMLEAAPQPEPLSDERIFDLLKQVDPHAVRLPLGFKQFAIAIEREILGENNDSN